LDRRNIAFISDESPFGVVSKFRACLWANLQLMASTFLFNILGHQTESLVFRNLSFDTKGDLTRLLLHYLDEFLSTNLQTINLALKYALLIIQVVTQPAWERPRK